MFELAVLGKLNILKKLGPDLGDINVYYNATVIETV